MLLNHFTNRLNRYLKIVAVLLLTILASLALPAGTLDNAPFRVVVAPGTDWKLDDSKSQVMGSNVFLVASLTNLKTQSKTVIIRTDLKDTSKSSLNEFFAGIKDSLSNPAVKSLSEEKTTFLGVEAKCFTYEITQGGSTTYNKTMVFVTNKMAWAVACVTTHADQKDELKQMLGFFQPKK